MELMHHGIRGQKWGVRNGPPYPLGGGDYSPSELKEKYKKKNKTNDLGNKKHFDKHITFNDTLSTLSYDPNRTKDTDMFYATYKKLDKAQYNVLFNRPVSKSDPPTLKFRIDNAVKSHIKVASEDSGSDIFKDLYSKDRDFYNFVKDPERMESYFVKDKYKFKGYRESKEVLERLQKPDYKPTEKDVKTLYRMFNYVIPYDGNGNERNGHDVANQRAKFFKEAKNRGYGALLDTNDAIYGAFKAAAPVIVFDMDAITPVGIERTKMRSKYASAAMLVGRKFLGV